MKYQGTKEERRKLAQKAYNSKPDRKLANAERAKVKFKLLKEKVLTLFGTKCVKCGFNDLRALQLDHILGKGHKERVKIGSMGVWKKALKEPENYQLFCANCNWIKRAENNETAQKY